MNRTELKQKAKESLTGHWGNIILLMLIPSLVSFALSGIMSFLGISVNEQGQLNGSITLAIIIFIASIIFTCYMKVVTSIYYLKVSRDENITLKEAFSKKNFIIPFLVITILISLLMILCYSPAFICMLFATQIPEFGIFGALLLLGGIIGIIILALMYMLAFYVKIDDPELSAIDSLKQSRELMKGHKVDLFVLYLSFIIWLLIPLVIMILGSRLAIFGATRFGGLLIFISIVALIPLAFYITIHMEITICKFYNQLIEQNK